MYICSFYEHKKKLDITEYALQYPLTLRYLWTQKSEFISLSNATVTYRFLFYDVIPADWLV